MWYQRKPPLIGLVRPCGPCLTCVYSPGNRFLKPRPSCLRSEWNTTVRVGALTPMAKVSVQNRTCGRVVGGWGLGPGLELGCHKGARSVRAGTDRLYSLFALSKAYVAMSAYFKTERGVGLVLLNRESQDQQHHINTILLGALGGGACPPHSPPWPPNTHTPFSILLVCHENRSGAQSRLLAAHCLEPPGRGGTGALRNAIYTPPGGTSSKHGNHM